MKILKFLPVLALLLFVGCARDAVLTPPPQIEPIWIPYIENNGTKMQISFKRGENFGTMKETNATMPLVGSAEFRAPTGERYIVRKIGDMYSLAHGKNNIIINLNTNSPIDPGSKEQMSALQRAKSFKFYEIGTGMVESIVYSAKGHVCEEFLANEPINVRSVTNYYLKKGGFFASIIDAKFIYKKGAKIENKSFYYEIEDENALKETREFTASESELFLNDLKKQGRLLVVLCGM
ncbi:hypothetical protein [Campylobacter curvus]|uniref:hypothetical protein n=1 Tax=Campylobacter curvus TaxID=200 RepID=UPI0014705711|nr:hypothetical protein [Campylobacter curvus]